MKQNPLLKKFLFIFFPAVFTLVGSSAFSADDPTIKGALREGVKSSMSSFIDGNTVGDTFYIYDTVEGKLLKLSYKKLHDGVVKKGDFYVSCADFTDEGGTLIDLDFMVIPDGDAFVTTQAIVHAVDGKKRKYHLEQ